MIIKFNRVHIFQARALELYRVIRALTVFVVGVYNNGVLAICKVHSSYSRSVRFIQVRRRLASMKIKWSHLLRVITG